MDNVRDKVESQIRQILEDRDWKRTDLILSIPELAIVDREAMPDIPSPPIYSDKPYSKKENEAFRIGALTCRNNMLNDDWVKEIK